MGIVVVELETLICQGFQLFFVEGCTFIALFDSYAESQQYVD